MLKELFSGLTDEMVTEWAERLHASSESYGNRQIYELRQTVRMAFEAYMKFMFEQDPMPLDQFINLIVEKRYAEGFKLSEALNGFELFRKVARQPIISELSKDDAIEALDLIDSATNYAVFNFGDKFNKKHEKETLKKNQADGGGLSSSQLKDQFIANVSHELRTPLTSIIGFSKIMLEAPKNDGKEKEKLKIIYDQGKALLQIINTLLLIADIDTGKAEISRDRINLPDMARFLVSNAKKLPASEKIEIGLNCPEEIPPFEGDQKKLEAAIGELLCNAVKFSHPGSSVKLNLRAEGNNLLIEVADSGIGFDAKETESVFASFCQLDGAINRKHGGCGLGLTMIGKVAQIHNGTVAVTSKKGEGSAFTITLPYPRSRA